MIDIDEGVEVDISSSADTVCREHGTIDGQAQPIDREAVFAQQRVWITQTQRGNFKLFSAKLWGETLGSQKHSWSHRAIYESK